MNTKHTLLECICASKRILDLIEKIDFVHLEKTVTEQLFAYLRLRGSDQVKYDLLWDVASPTDAFLDTLMDEGAVALLQENNLLRDEQFIDALYIIISAINIVIATFLRQLQIADVASYCYLDAERQYQLLERGVERVNAVYEKEGRHSGLMALHLQAVAGELAE